MRHPAAYIGHVQPANAHLSRLPTGACGIPPPGLPPRPLAVASPYRRWVLDMACWLLLLLPGLLQTPGSFCMPRLPAQGQCAAGDATRLDAKQHASAVEPGCQLLLQARSADGNGADAGGCVECLRAQGHLRSGLATVLLDQASVLAQRHLACCCSLCPWCSPVLHGPVLLLSCFPFTPALFPPPASLPACLPAAAHTGGAGDGPDRAGNPAPAAGHAGGWVVPWGGLSRAARLAFVEAQQVVTHARGWALVGAGKVELRSGPGWWPDGPAGCWWEV